MTMTDGKYMTMEKVSPLPYPMVRGRGAGIYGILQILVTASAADGLSGDVPAYCACSEYSGGRTVKSADKELGFALVDI